MEVSGIEAGLQCVDAKMCAETIGKEVHCTRSTYMHCAYEYKLMLTNESENAITA